MADKNFSKIVKQSEQEMHSISLIDIRCECLILIREISVYRDILDKGYDYIIDYMKDNLILNNLVCFKIEKKIPILSLSINNTESNSDFSNQRLTMVYIINIVS